CLQIIDCKPVSTYTGPVTHRQFGALVLLIGTCALGPPAARAQAIQKSIYASVVNQSGAPVADLGPSDFIVREDNIRREVLRVAPADEPLQVALLVDTSNAARDDIFHIREAVTAFVRAL